MHLSHAAFHDIRNAVHDLCGIVIADDKQYLVKARSGAHSQDQRTGFL